MTAAAEKVARAKGIKCLVGPAINGWVGVYPENNGQDQSIGEGIARAVKGEVIQLIVHDDDVFAYWYWRDGELIDSYWSRPGYFGEEDRAEQEAMRGRPEVFEDLVGTRLEKLEALLEREGEKHLFESDRLEQFAKLLGISNAMTAYEYLKGGETEGVKRWKEFIEVPQDEIRAEDEARAERKKQIASLKKQLKSERVLLFEESRKGLIPRACQAGEGFIVGWHGMAAKKSELVCWHAPPWKKGTPIDVEVNTSVNVVASTGDGGLVVISVDDRALAWRSDHPVALTPIPHVKWIVEASLSADGRLVVHSDHDGVCVSEVFTGKRVALMGRAGAAKAVLHPSGQWLVAAHMGICLMEMKEEAETRELYVGGRSALGEAMAGILTQRLAAMDIDAILEKQKSAMEEGFAQIIAMAGKGKHVLTQEQIDAMRTNMQYGLEEYQKELLKAKAGERTTPVQGNERPACIAFSEDGTRMWCGTDKGVRGYTWEDMLLVRGDDMPPPRWQFEAPFVYAVTEERDGAGVVFAGYDGKVRRMEITSREVREILSVPDGGAVIGFCLSANGAAMGVISQPGMWDIPHGRDDRGVWQVWSYEKLARKCSTLPPLT